MSTLDPSGLGRFYEAPPWRFIVTDLEHATLTWLDKLAFDRAVTISRAAARVVTLRVPSASPEVNIPAPSSDDEPFVAEGIRFLIGFRREGPTGSADTVWNPRASTIVLDVKDDADTDHATTTVTGFDPWKLLYRRPVLDPDTGDLPESTGLIYVGQSADQILLEQLETMLVNQTPGAPLADAAIDFGQTGFYAGTVESCDAIDELTLQSGMMLGELCDTLVATGTCDIVLDPIYDPTDRPGLLVELSIYQRSGSYKPAAIFGWDTFPKNVVQLSRQQAGTERANHLQFFAGGGGAQAFAVPEETDAASIALYGDYWSTQYLPGQPSVAGAHTLAQRQLALNANGQFTYSLSPAAERAPIVLTEYREGDTVPLYASDRFRDPISGEQPRVEGIPIVIGDDQLERVNSLLVSIEATPGS